MIKILKEKKMQEDNNKMFMRMLTNGEKVSKKKFEVFFNDLNSKSSIKDLESDDSDPSLSDFRLSTKQLRIKKKLKTSSPLKKLKRQATF